MIKRAFIVPVVLLVIAILSAGCGGLFVVEPMTTEMVAGETPPPPPTPVVLVSAADLMLDPWDCSAGYESLDPEAIGLEPGAPFIEDLTIASGYVLVKSEEEDGILSATTWISDQAQRETFDAYLRAPETFMPTFLAQVGAMDLTILAQEPIAPLEGTGDDAMGMAVTYEYTSRDGLFHIDVILFRRDAVGAYTMVVYPDESGPLMPVTELAFTLDDLVVENLASAPQEGAAQVDYAGLGSGLWDCPPGYMVIRPSDGGIEPGAAFTEDLAVAGSFFYSKAEPDAALAFGLTTLISEPAQRRAFDAFLAQPETFLPSFMAFVGDTGIGFEPQEPITLRLEIGDAATAVTMMVLSDEGPARFDVVIFRRGVVGAFVVSAYLDGQANQATVEDLASRLDGMIARVLAGEPAVP